MSISMSAAVCLIACHGGPGDHFATYAEVLAGKGYEVQVHATGPAVGKFQERGVKVQAFSLESLTGDQEDCLAETIASACKTAPVIITDVGHSFDVKLQRALSVYASGARRFAYYDNPEPFVPGGYSKIAAEVIGVAQGVLFANANLVGAKIYSDFGVEVDLSGKKRFGIGYYPVNQAEKIAERRRSDHEAARAAFLMNHEMKDTGQKIWVYFGGNNQVYFSDAFPAFLSFVAKACESLKNTVIVLQQHPGAKAQNLDGKMVEEQGSGVKILVSNFSSDHAQVLADAALYYQTSMGPQFVLEGIPAIQVGHETYEDILVKNGLAPTVTSAEGLAEAMVNLEQIGKMPQEDLLKSLGIKEDWREMLESVVK